MDLTIAVQHNFLAYLRQFNGVPGIELYESDEVTWFVSTLGAPGNHVVRTQLAEAAEPARRVAKILEQIGRYTDWIDWLLFPGDSPAGLELHLAACGLEPREGSPWMVADLAELPPVPITPPAFRVERITDAGGLRLWRLVSAAGFEMSMPAVQPYYDAYIRQDKGPKAMSHCYIGYLGQEPVTSATLVLDGELAGIYDVSTPPRVRRRGFGRAITWAAMRDAQARGYRQVCLMASPLGRRLYESLGFTFCVLPHEYRWHKSSWVGSSPSVGRSSQSTLAV